jgi:hypothetical protein
MKDECLADFALDAEVAAVAEADGPHLPPRHA